MTGKRSFAPRRLAGAAVLLAALPAAARDGDTSGMAAPQRLSAGLPRRVVVSGQVAYLALDTGVQTLDLASPASPATMGRLDLPGEAQGIALAGPWLFVAQGEAGLAVVDVQDPSRLLLATTVATSGTRAVAVQGNVAYLAEASTPPLNVHGLRTLDVSDPHAPVPLGFLPLPNGALDVAVTGTTAFVALGSVGSAPDQGLLSIDVSNPVYPTLNPAGWVDLGLPVRAVALAPGLAYVAAGLPATGLFATFDISDPAAPVLVDESALCDQASGVALAGATAYVAAGQLGVLSYDLASPAAPRPLDMLASGRPAAAVAARGDLTLVAERGSTGAGGLGVLDTLAPGTLRAQGFVAAAEATGVATAGGFAYLLRRDGLDIYDASRPGALAPLSTWTTPGADYTAIAVSLPLAAVADGKVVHLLGVGYPGQPAEVASITLSDGFAVRLALSATRLHVVTGIGLESFDVSAPGSPVSLGTFATPRWSAALALDGTLGYLTAGDTLYVLDLTDAPGLVGSLAIPGEQLYGVAVAGTKAVVTGLSNRLHVLDVTTLASPQLLGTLVGGRGFDVALAGETALVAAGEDGLLAVDLADPARPALRAWLDTSGRAVSVAVSSDDDVYLATLEAAHWALRCDVCPPGCTESWPVVAANSLKLVRGAGAGVLSWTHAAGSGESNVHRTPAKSALPAIAADAASIAGNTAGLSFSDGFQPAPGAAVFYRVFGRGSCSGASHEN